MGGHREINSFRFAGRQRQFKTIQPPADMFVENKVILELKSAEKVTAAHKKQIQTCLRLTGQKLGYLLNYGEALMKHGIMRAVNNLKE